MSTKEDLDTMITFVCEGMEDLTVEQRKECVRQVIMAKENFSLEKVKETGEGLMIPTSALDEQTWKDLYMHIKYKLEAPPAP
jgi:PHD/YefM family antitoxin component YafN of YafNO toxin-antitoxin module